MYSCMYHFIYRIIIHCTYKSLLRNICVILSLYRNLMVLRLLCSYIVTTDRASTSSKNMSQLDAMYCVFAKWWAVKDMSWVDTKHVIDERELEATFDLSKKRSERKSQWSNRKNTTLCDILTVSTLIRSLVSSSPSWVQISEEIWSFRDRRKLSKTGRNEWDSKSHWFPRPESELDNKRLLGMIRWQVYMHLTFSNLENVWKHRTFVHAVNPAGNLISNYICDVMVLSTDTDVRGLCFWTLQCRHQCNPPDSLHS